MRSVQSSSKLSRSFLATNILMKAFATSFNSYFSDIWVFWPLLSFYAGCLSLQGVGGGGGRGGSDIRRFRYNATIRTAATKASINIIESHRGIPTV